MIHWPNLEIPVAEVVKGLAKAKRQGVARHIGIANFNTTLIEQALKSCPEPIVALQAEYHPYLDQTKVLAACDKHGLAFVAYCPLGRGRLFDDPVLNEIARSRSRTVAQIALRWLMQQNVAAIPARQMPAASRQTSMCSISRSAARRWSASPRSSGPMGASPTLSSACRRGISRILAAMLSTSCRGDT